MAAGFSFCIRSSGIVVVDCAPCCPGEDSSVSHGASLQACICGITLVFVKRGVRPVRLHVVSLSNHVALVADPCGFTVRPWFRCPTLVWCPTRAVSLSDPVLSLSGLGGFVAVIIRAPCETIAIGIATQGRTATPHWVGQQHRTGVGQLSDLVWCCCPTLCGSAVRPCVVLLYDPVWCCCPTLCGVTTRARTTIAVRPCVALLSDPVWRFQSRSSHTEP